MWAKIGESLSCVGIRYDEVEEDDRFDESFRQTFTGDYDRHAFYGIIQFLQGLAFDIQGCVCGDEVVGNHWPNEMAQEVRQTCPKKWQYNQERNNKMAIVANTGFLSVYGLQALILEMAPSVDVVILPDSPTLSQSCWNIFIDFFVCVHLYVLVIVVPEKI